MDKDTLNRITLNIESLAELAREWDDLSDSGKKNLLEDIRESVELLINSILF